MLPLSEPHIRAAVTLFGMTLDLLGALYLSYELLGGKDGPLRPLTEFISYSFAGLVVGLLAALGVFYAEVSRNFNVVGTLGYASALGIAIGYAAGAGTGVGFGYAVSIVLRRSAQRAGKGLLPRKLFVRLASAIVIGAVVVLIHFSALVLQSSLIPRYISGFQPTLFLGLVLGGVGGVFFGLTAGWLLVKAANDIAPNFDRDGLAVGVLCGLTVGIAGAISYWLVFGPDLIAPLIVDGTGGLICGVIAGALIGSAPIVEWRVYSLPERTMGVIGTVMILIGFSIQSIPYWAALLNVQP